MVSTTIGLLGTYISYNLWEAATVDGDSATGTSIDSTNLLTADLTIDIANTGGWTYMITADASSQVSTPTYANMSSKARAVSTGSNAFAISTTGVVIEKIGVMSPAGGQGIQINAACTLRRLLMVSNVATIRITSSATGTNTLSNIGILRNGNAGAFNIYSDAATTNVYQTSIVQSSNSGIGIYAGGTVSANACIVQVATTNNYYGPPGGNYNAAQDTSAPGAQSVQSQSGLFTNTTATTENLTLTSTTAVDIVNRSGYPADTDTDIVGTSRPSTLADAGCWQNASTPPSGVYIGNQFFQLLGLGI